MNAKESIKSMVSIVDVVSGCGVNLTEFSGKYKGLCPFHSERTPSFYVYPETGTYWCYGCGSSGDMFSFIQKMAGVGFFEALKLLADKYNIPLGGKDSGQKSRENCLGFYEVNRIAMDIFVQKIYDIKCNAMGHLRSGRNLSLQAIADFSIGYAPCTEEILESLSNRGVSNGEAMEHGLLIMKEELFESRFQRRIMFPIINECGLVVGFGGRIWASDEWLPKYINSPGSLLFNKSKTLYGMNIAKQYIMAQDEAIIVEGYMDAVKLHDAGFKNVVASLGTALTSDQIHLISRLTRNIYLFYDADAAGVKATVKAIGKLFEFGIVPLVIGYGDTTTEDPDNLIDIYGASKLKELKRLAVNGADFIVNVANLDPVNKFAEMLPEGNVKGALLHALKRA